MADRALSEEAMLAGLRDIHLPPAAPSDATADLLAAAGIGLALALVVGAALRTVTARRRPPDGRTGAPTGELDRVQALFRLKVRRPERFALFRPLLYRRGEQPDLETVLRELRGHD